MIVAHSIKKDPEWLIEFRARGTLTKSDKWTFRLTPYFVGAAMDGSLTLREHTAGVEVGFDQILENLDFGAMLHLLATKGPWSIGLDGIYMGLGQTADQPPAEVNMDQWMVELTGGSRLTPWLDLLVGARYNFLSSDIAFQGPLGKVKGGNVDWIDPIRFCFEKRVSRKDAKTQRTRNAFPGPTFAALCLCVKGFVFFAVIKLV